MGQRLTYWIFLGIIGLAVFFMLHSSISFNAGAPIQESRAAIEEKTAELVSQLGFSADSLNMMTERIQHLNYYQVLKDSTKEELPPINELNERGLNLTGWQVNIGATQSEGEIISEGMPNFIDDLGRLQVIYDQQGKVRRISTYSSNPNPTFVAGDSLFSIANHIVSEILGYQLEHYELNFVDVKDTVITTKSGFGDTPVNLSDTSVGNNMIFSWTKRDSSEGGPRDFLLEVRPLIRETSAPNMASIQYGVSIEDFKALDQYEPKELQLYSTNNISTLYLIVSFGSLGLLALLVFFVGIKHINKGQVEWRRAIFVLLSVASAVLIWRILYLMNMMDGFLNQTSQFLFILTNLVYAAVMGLYGAMAYIGWEAVARDQNQQQLHLLDAFWNKRFFFRETGEALLRGFALSGTLLGIYAVGLYMMGTEYYQHDSQYRFAEASMNPKLLTINLALWINVCLVSLGHLGVITGFLKSKINNIWLFYGTGIVLTGFLFAGSATLFQIIGPAWYDLIIYSVLAAVILYAWETAGIVTFATAWWVFTAVMMIMPYWGSSSLDVAYVSWSQLFILGIPLIYGFIAFKYGDSISETGGYIPEYQERMANHLRVEKEIEIARESQFKLMPLKPPEIQGVDVYGFFMPSFEVGGDYFDYILSNNGSEGSQILNMTIADVSGKAMKAAMHAVFTSGLLLSRLHQDAPETILREITPTLFTRTDRQTFITCLIAQYHPQTQLLRLANAGHCLPILKRNGKAEFVSTPEPRYPLGIRNSVTYHSLDISLQQGDFLLLYSDGLPEAVNPKGERFGFNTLLSLVEDMDTDSRPSNEISMDIKRRIQKFSDYQLADDTTIICLKV